MFESIEDLIAVVAGLTVLWLIFGIPSKEVDDGRSQRLGPGGSADGRHGGPAGRRGHAP
jgi:hypothetical protein